MAAIVKRIKRWGGAWDDEVLVRGELSLQELGNVACQIVVAAQYGNFGFPSYKLILSNKDVRVVRKWLNDWQG